eukprot:6061537-Prymnesium_polylepis.1
MVVKTATEVRCMVSGDVAMERYDSYCPLEYERTEPLSAKDGPLKGDVLLVRIGHCRAACEVLEVGGKKGRPLYTLKYDDDMLVQDHLVVPWCYLSTALQPDEAASDGASNAAANVADSDTAAAPMSEKAKGKRRAIDVMAEAAEAMTLPSPDETAAPSPPPPTTPAPADPEEYRVRKRWERRELRQEQEYGELLDSIIL